MQVKIYSFTKKNNSTKQPGSSAGVTHNCNLKNDCSIINPIIEFEMFTSAGSKISPADYNYAYIPSFGRYYYINDWVFKDNKWVAYMSIDALASFKTDIGNYETFILRSSHSHNTKIIDNFPTRKSVPSIYKNSVNRSSIKGYDGNPFSTEGDFYDTTFWRKPIDYGRFILSVTSVKSQAGLKYYMLDYSNFMYLLSELIGYEPLDMESVDAGIARQIYNPLQYINNCFWVPSIPITPVEEQRKLYIGPSFDKTFWWTDITSLEPVYEATFTIENHDQYDTFGDFVNYSDDLTKRTLFIPPFGSIQLPADKIVGTTIKIKIAYDINSNKAHLTVLSGTNILAEVDGEFGVKIDLTQVTASLSLGGLANMAFNSSFLIKQIPKLDIKNGENFVQKWGSDMLQWAELYSNAAFSPQVNGSMNYGTLYNFSPAVDEPYIQSEFILLSEIDNNNIGRPLCSVEKISDIPGFIVCRTGNISSSATEQEKNLINRYLTGGFFYE